MYEVVNIFYKQVGDPLPTARLKYFMYTSEKPSLWPLL